MFNYNPITAVDFYKINHINQYPEGTEYIYSNLTPRSSRLAKKSSFAKDGVVFFGLQGFLLNIIQDDFLRNFFGKPLEVVKAQWQRRMDSSLGPGAVGFDHIEALHKLGYLPIRIKAIKEGSFVPSKVPMLTITNTLPEFFWVTNFLETLLSAELWKATTVATIAAEYKRLLVHYAKKTGTPVEFTEWQGHDFSFRGVGGVSDTGYSAGHLLSFLGTDTIPAMDYLEQFYNGGSTFLGGSVPASEHSTASCNILLIEQELKDKGEWNGYTAEEVDKLL